MVLKLTFCCFWKLQVAKVQSAPSAQPVAKSTAHSDMNHVPEPPAQQSSVLTVERSGAEAVEDTSVMEDEGTFL